MRCRRHEEENVRLGSHKWELALKCTDFSSLSSMPIGGRIHSFHSIPPRDRWTSPRTISAIPARYLNHPPPPPYEENISHISSVIEAVWGEVEGNCYPRRQTSANFCKSSKKLPSIKLTGSITGRKLKVSNSQQLRLLPREKDECGAIYEMCIVEKLRPSLLWTWCR